MGSRGAGSGRNGGSYKNSQDYKDEFRYEIQSRHESAAVPAALSSNILSDDATIETQMRGYAAAIGDPIRAMETQRETLKQQLDDYKGAKKPYELGVRDATKQLIKEYDTGIERMKRIKKNSKRPDLL